MMKTKKERQSEEQRKMRACALMLHELRLDVNPDAALKDTARIVWKLHPKGYRSFGYFYESVRRLGPKSTYNR